MSCLRESNAEPIPGYRLVEPLGSGGFGEVWKCIAPGGLYKAIKFVFGNINSLDLDGARAEQELKALNRIREVRHPFVVSLDRIENVEGEILIVMELADRSLHDLYIECQAAGLVGIPRDALLRYIRDAAEALDHMNGKHNLQHLDIKPRNLFLVSDRVKVADFGLVNNLGREISSGLIGGATPLYAAPETFNGKISERSDQYSLAIVYQELLTGQRPFNGRNPRQLAQQHLQEAPELRALPEAERPIIARALSKDPVKRFPSCLALVRALYAAQTPARPGDPPGPEASGSQRRPKTLAETLEDIQLEQPSESTTGEASPSGEEAEDLSRLGITVAQPQSGSLRPTVIVGVGSFGRRALRELRCRFLDRLGDLRKIPLVRFLYVDTDPEAVQDAIRGTAEVAFSRNEVYLLPLQPVGHYRRRALDQLTEWLPREKLYGLPRSLQTQGSRALGRLAFVDNHLRLLARLRREVQQVTHPDAIYQGVSQTGLALRDGVPRVYVIAAAGGGSSGLLTDLGYSLRRMLHQLRHPDAEVNLFLFCGAPADPATPHTEQANVYATLTEFNHFGDPTIPFAAQYGVDGPRLVEQGNPYSSSYLIQLAHRSPEALRDVVAHLGNYLFHELTTPLGLRLDRERQLPPPAGATGFRSFGTYAIWFPRGLLLRLAARQVCRRLIEDWQAAGEPIVAAEVDAACARVLADSELRPEALGVRLEEGARPALGGTPAETLTRLLGALEEQCQQSVALDDLSNWTRQAVSRVLECVGPGLASEITVLSSHPKSGDWRQSRLARALKSAVDRLAAEWDQQLALVAFSLMDHAGRRVAAAEAGLMRMVHFCADLVAAQQVRWEQQAARTRQAATKLESTLQGCFGEANGNWGLGTLLLFGNRTRRLLRVFMDHLAAFARLCQVEEVIHAEQLFFTVLKGRLENRLQEIAFCRQRLRHLQEKLESPLEEAADLATTQLGSGVTPSHSPLPSPESFWESIRQARTVRVILPDGTVDLEQAAARFAGTLGKEQTSQLDLALQDHVLAPLGGLHAGCSGSDLVRGLALPLLNHAARFLDEHLPITDVAAVEMGGHGDGDHDIAMQVRDYMVRSTPLVVNKEATQQSAFLLVPATPAGTRYGEAARQVVADLQVLSVPGQAHLLFCREQGYLSVDELHGLLRPCRAAYEEAVLLPQASPHARFDILDWVPLDP
jgi:serine/threonine protein kinase